MIALGITSAAHTAANYYERRRGHADLRARPKAECNASENSRPSEIALILVLLNHFAPFIVNADHGIMGATVILRVCEPALSNMTRYIAPSYRTIRVHYELHRMITTTSINQIAVGRR
jgi:hypothetical protein